MEKVLIAYSGRLPATFEVAEAIAQQLVKRGFAVDVRATCAAQDAWKYDAVIVGSPVSSGHWDKDAVHYLRAQAPDLAERPTWLFQCSEAGSAGPYPYRLPRPVTQFCYEAGAHDVASFDPDHHLGDQAATWANAIADQLVRDLVTA
jgi:menaquinone-dependent protoporphyrinogen oxidase